MKPDFSLESAVVQVVSSGRGGGHSSVASVFALDWGGLGKREKQRERERERETERETDRERERERERDRQRLRQRQTERGLTY